MTELPDALRLAAWFESFYKEASIPAQAAAELRRLHAENQELLEALKKISAIENKDYGSDWEEIEEARDIADAAIAKAEGANND